MAYCETADVYLAYGTANVTRWADVDNLQDQVTIDNRLAWAIENATNYIDSRLDQGPYEIPFELMPNTPQVIKFMTSIWAGILLHDARAVTSENPDQVARQRMQFEKYVRQIMRGQLKITGLEKKGHYPNAVGGISNGTTDGYSSCG